MDEAPTEQARQDAEMLQRAADELMDRIRNIEQRQEVPAEYTLYTASRLLEALSQSISAGHPQTPQVLEAAIEIARYALRPPSGAES